MRKWRRALVGAAVAAFTVLFFGKAEVARAAECTEHVYDYACDHKCNVCEAYRVTDHNYDTVCYDANFCWTVCECGKVWNKQPHFYSNEKERKCAYCDYKRELTHSYVTQEQDELYHWQVCDCGMFSERELHTYSGANCTNCGHKKPDWYEEEKHLIIDGVEYLSIEEAGAYVREHLAARNVIMEVRFYFELEKELQSGEAFSALFEEACKYTGKATEGDILRSAWTGAHESDEIFDGKIHYYTIKNWTPYYASNAEQEQWLTEEIHRIFKTLKIDTMNDYEKVCAIYKYICDNVSYGTEINEPGWNDSHTDELVNAYWALKTGYAICDGYGDLVYRMMMEAGIDTRIISSTVGAHEWNIVKLDGKYYCVDATNDAGKEIYFNFLLGLPEFRAVTGGADHLEDPQYHTVEFWEEYPVSFTSYGKTFPQTGSVVAKGEEDGIRWEVSKDGILTVSGNGKIESPYWMEWRGFIKKAIIKEGITEFGWTAFAYCPVLEEVVIPESVTVLGDRSFAYCDRLKSISLPSGLISVGASAFEGCNDLKEVILPESVEYVGAGAFRMCYSLERVVLGKKMTKIEEKTFWRSENLREVVMYEGIKEIGYGAFMECCGLEQLILPDTVKKLGDYAFQEAFSYERKVSFTVPESVKQIGHWCFQFCNVGELFYNSSAKIVDEMFIECRCLERLVLGPNVKEIGNKAFAYCVVLKEIEWQGDLEKVGEYAFRDCTSLEKVVIPGTLETVGMGMFERCTGLETIVFSEGVTTICEYAFSECTSLREVTIPKSVMKMESVAFGWNGLEKVFFEGAPPETTSGDVPLHQFFGTAYYWSDRGEWTKEAKNRLANDGSVTWVNMLGDDDNEENQETLPHFDIDSDGNRDSERPSEDSGTVLDDTEGKNTSGILIVIAVAAVILIGGAGTGIALMRKKQKK